MWRKDDLWLPEGMEAYEGEPLLVVTRSNFHVHEEIQAEGPDYPVYLIRPFAPTYGLRIRDWQIRHVPEDVLHDPRFREWLNVCVRCRVSGERLNA